MGKSALEEAMASEAEFEQQQAEATAKHMAALNALDDEHKAKLRKIIQDALPAFEELIAEGRQLKAMRPPVTNLAMNLHGQLQHALQQTTPVEALPVSVAQAQPV
jgi:ClpP class serine protease